MKAKKQKEELRQSRSERLDQILAFLSARQKGASSLMQTEFQIHEVKHHIKQFDNEFNHYRKFSIACDTEPIWKLKLLKKRYEILGW